MPPGDIPWERILTKLYEQIEAGDMSQLLATVGEHVYTKGTRPWKSSGIPQQNAKKKTCAVGAALSKRSNLALSRFDLQ